MKMDNGALNNTEKGKPKYSVDNLSQCRCVYRKSHMDRHLIEHRPQQLEAGDKTEWAIPPALKIIIKLNCIYCSHLMDNRLCPLERRNR
jgi:hypothetical protein